MRHLTTFISVLLAGLVATASHAAEEPPLYRVELVVFVNTGSGTGEESWPQPQGLAYPEHWRILDADEFAAAAGFNPFDEPEAIEGTEPGALGPDAVRADTGPVADSGGSPVTLGSDPDPEDEQSPAWRSLPESDWLLADSAARIARSGRYQVVLHQAWLQPLGNREENPALVLAGGERFGNHHELEGFLSLRQERYIHVDAELWLSRFRFGSGLEATLFSPLPTPPQLIRPAAWSHWFGEQDSNAGSGVEPTVEEPSLHTASQSSPEQSAEMGGDSAWTQSVGTGFGHNTGFSVMSRFDSNYVPSQIFVLKQRQRVEPDQLTYLDHPLMGALLLVKPVPADTD